MVAKKRKKKNTVKRCRKAPKKKSSPKITILQKGGSKWDYGHGKMYDRPDLIRNIIKDVAKEIGISSRMMNTQKFRVEMRKTKLSKGISGFHYSPATGSRKTMSHTIVLRRDVPIDRQLGSIIHEMQHAKQNMYGDL